MDWLQFTASVVGSLAWPLAAVFLGFMFREQVRKLLDKMKSLKAPGGIEADFSLEAKKVAEEAKQLPAPMKLEGMVPQSLAEQHAIMSLITEERPTALILDTWRNIERAILEVITDRGYALDPKSLINVKAWIDAISSDHGVTPEIIDLINELHTLRNKVAHNMFEPDQQAAFNYMMSAQKVIDSLRATVYFKGSVIDGGGA